MLFDQRQKEGRVLLVTLREKPADFRVDGAFTHVPFGDVRKLRHLLPQNGATMEVFPVFFAIFSMHCLEQAVLIPSLSERSYQSRSLNHSRPLLKPSWRLP